MNDFGQFVTEVLITEAEESSFQIHIFSVIDREKSLNVIAIDVSVSRPSEVVAQPKGSVRILASMWKSSVTTVISEK